MSGMKNMTLAHMAEACGGILYGREEDRNREVCAITTDSRKAEPGCLFAAIPGERVDGHDFIDQVFEKGALCVITEREPEEFAGNYIKVESTIRALGTLSAYYLEQLAIPVVGITGSVGKTSTKEMIAAVLSQKYRTLKTAGNFNNELGLPLTIFRLRDEDEIAVLEMGINHFGEMHRLAAIAKPDTCVITNIGQCHLEYLGDRDGVLRAKTEIFDYLRPDAHIVLNGDDDKLETVREVRIPADSCSRAKSAVDGVSDTDDRNQCPVGGNAAVIRPTFFGLGMDNDIYADQIEKKGLDGIACRICIKKGRELPGSAVMDEAAENEGSLRTSTDESNLRTNTDENGLRKNTNKSSLRTDADAAGEYDSFTVQIPIPGEHMVRNALAATAVGLHYGLTTEEIRAGIESLQPVSGRFHIIHTENFTIIDDCYNANPMSMKASLGVLQDSGMDSKGTGIANGCGEEANGTGDSRAMRLEQDSRKVAILGDMGELGEDEVQMHRSVGEYAGGLDIDLCICVGPLSTHIAEGIHDIHAADAAKESGAANAADVANETGAANAADAAKESGATNAADAANETGAAETKNVAATNAAVETVVLPDLSTLLEKLPALVRKGDTILVKASHFMHFEKIIAQLENMKAV